MSRPFPSLVAERAVRYLRESDGPVSSTRLASEVLAIRTADERHATRVLGSAFAGDPRLEYADGGWRPVAVEPHDAADAPSPLEDCIAYVLVEGSRPAPRSPFVLTAAAAMLRRGGNVLAACGGDLERWSSPHALKHEFRQLLVGARVVLHAPRGGLSALEAWLEEPLEDPLPLALLGRRRAGAGQGHSIADLAARLGLAARVEDDAARRLELVAACYESLVRPGETWSDLTAACRGNMHAVPWRNLAFTPDDLRAVPASPGTYRFLAADGTLVYVGKSKNLRRRLATWFRDGAPRTERQRAIVETVHRFEAVPSGSDLEAVLREAAQITRDTPAGNVQRQIHAAGGRARRLASILVLEPAEAPWVLRAWLIREGRLIESVALGPRGGGLKRVYRILESEFFDPRDGPRSTTSHLVDVELVARWLSEHRDKAVAFDPTHLKTADEVVARLRWFLERREITDPGGFPILPR